MLSNVVLSGLRGNKGGNLFSSKMRLLRKAQPASSFSSAVKRVEEPHMNHIPQPTSFEAVDSKRQKGNNFVLVAGIIFFSFSTAYVLNSGVIVPNLTPPRKNPE